MINCPQMSIELTVQSRDLSHFPHKPYGVLVFDCVSENDGQKRLFPTRKSVSFIDGMLNAYLSEADIH